MSTELKTLNGYGFDATKLGGLDAQYYAKGRAVHNWLDNSNFQINQRGKTIYNAAGYNIDRWYTNMGENAKVTVGSGKITISKSSTGGSFQQTLPFDMTGKTMTYAVKTANGVTCKSAVISSSSSFAQIDGVNAYLGVFVDNGQTFFQIYFNDSSSITLDLYWAALYEGSYDASTLPAYQPKGYAAELAECQMYYRRGLQAVTIGTIYTTGSIFSLYFPKMRIHPTINILEIMSQGWGDVDINNYTQGWGEDYGSEHYVNFTSSITADVGKTVVVKYENSADL